MFLSVLKYMFHSSPTPDNRSVLVVTLVVVLQALLQKEGEKAALVERLQGVQQDLVSAGLDLQRTRREAQSRLEQDKVTPSTHTHTHLP